MRPFSRSLFKLHERSIFSAIQLWNRYKRRRTPNYRSLRSRKLSLFLFLSMAGSLFRISLFQPPPYRVCSCSLRFILSSFHNVSLHFCIRCDALRKSTSSIFVYSNYRNRLGYRRLEYFYEKFTVSYIWYCWSYRLLHDKSHNRTWKCIIEIYITISISLIYFI